MMEAVRRQAAEFDVLHFHLDYWPFSLFTRQRTPFVTTLHGRLDLPELQPVFDNSPNVPRGVDLRRPAPAAAAGALGRHRPCTACRSDLLTPQPVKPSLSGLPRPHLRRRSAPIARSASPGAAGIPLKIAAKVDRADQDYFDDAIRPMLEGPARRDDRRDQRCGESRLS